MQETINTDHKNSPLIFIVSCILFQRVDSRNKISWCRILLLPVSTFLHILAETYWMPQQFIQSTKVHSFQVWHPPFICNQIEKYVQENTSTASQDQNWPLGRFLWGKWLDPTFQGQGWRGDQWPQGPHSWTTSPHLLNLVGQWGDDEPTTAEPFWSCH